MASWPENFSSSRLLSISLADILSLTAFLGRFPQYVFAQQQTHCHRSNDEKTQLIQNTNHHTVGGVAAAVSKTAAAPIERVKLLIQNQVCSQTCHWQLSLPQPDVSNR